MHFNILFFRVKQIKTHFPGSKSVTPQANFSFCQTTPAPLISKSSIALSLSAQLRSNVRASRSFPSLSLSFALHHAAIFVRVASNAMASAARAPLPQNVSARRTDLAAASPQKTCVRARDFQQREENFSPVAKKSTFWPCTAADRDHGVHSRARQDSGHRKRLELAAGGRVLGVKRRCQVWEDFFLLF